MIALRVVFAGTCCLHALGLPVPQGFVCQGFVSALRPLDMVLQCTPFAAALFNLIMHLRSTLSYAQSVLDYLHFMYRVTQDVL
jgi:hypothetical protein